MSLVRIVVTRVGAYYTEGECIVFTSSQPHMAYTITSEPERAGWMRRAVRTIRLKSATVRDMVAQALVCHIRQTRGLSCMEKPQSNRHFVPTCTLPRTLMSLLFPRSCTQSLMSSQCLNRKREKSSKATCRTCFTTTNPSLIPRCVVL